MRLVALLVLASACGGAASSTRSTTPKPPPKTVELEPLLVEVGDPATGGEVRVYDARNLLDDGNDALVQRRFDEALAAFDNLLRDFPGSKLAVAAQYNAGLALEGKRDWAGAAERFRRVLATGRDPEHREDFVNAHFRLGAVLAEIEQFAESARVLEQVLERTDLPPDHRIEALARLGYALVESKDYAAGEEVLRKGIAYHREVQGTHRLDSTHFVAMAQFYLAMIPHRQFGAVPLRYPEQQMSRDLDQKSQLFLLARDRYIKVVDYKDAQWATAAVYQVAHMYKEFWDAWMAVPIPAELNATEAKEYVRQMNQEPNLKKLLEKSLLFHERNIAMAESVRAATQWSRLSIEEAETVRKIIARQASGDLVEPGVAPAPAAGPKDSPPAGSRVYFPARREL